MIKELLIFTTGLAVGVGGAFVFFNNKIDAEIDAQIDEMKAYYENKYTKAFTKEEKALESPENDLKSHDIEEVFRKRDDEEHYDRDSIVEKLNYGAMFKGQKNDISEEEEENTVMNQTNTKGEYPCIISDGEFYSDDDYKKVTVTYYSESKDFVTGRGTPIPYDDMIDNIGDEKFLEEFGAYETDTLFVRNPEQETDYEIILEESEYDGE